MADYRQLFGYASILFGAGFFARSFTPAHAVQGPSVSMGSNPYDALYGQVPNGETTVLSVPSDQTFIVTTVTFFNSSQVELKIDGNVVLYGSIFTEQQGYISNFVTGKGAAGYGYAKGNAFLNGNAHLPVDPGSSLSLQCANTSCAYYIEGYYAQP